MGWEGADETGVSKGRGELEPSSFERRIKRSNDYSKFVFIVGVF